MPKSIRTPRPACPTAPAAAYYDRKIAEGKTRNEAMRCLKRRLYPATVEPLQSGALG